MTRITVEQAPDRYYCVETRMEYDIQIRYLSRVFYRKPPPFKPRVIDGINVALGVADLGMEPVQQLALHNLQMTAGMALTGSGWQVVSGAESVDVEYRALGDESGTQVSFDDFIKRATAAQATAFGAASEQPHRLAVVAEGLLPELGPDRMDAVANRVLRFPPVFPAAPSEWDWRTINSVPRTWGRCSERTNTVLIIKRMSGILAKTNGKFERIRIDVDINTDPKVQEGRFTGEDVSAFHKQAIGWNRELSAEINRFIGL
jgi:hypothetical protein